MTYYDMLLRTIRRAKKKTTRYETLVARCVRARVIGVSRVRTQKRPYWTAVPAAAGAAALPIAHAREEGVPRNLVRWF